MDMKMYKQLAVSLFLLLLLFIITSPALLKKYQKTTSITPKPSVPEQTELSPLPIDYTVKPAVISTSDWGIFTFKQADPRGGDYFHTIEILHPTNWTVKKIAVTPTEDQLISDCLHVQFLAPDNLAVLDMQQKCTSYDQEELPWPNSTQVLKITENAADDGSTRYLLRFSSGSSYKYGDLLLERTSRPNAKTEISDDFSITHDPFRTHRFISAKATLTIHSENSNLLDIADEIIKSAKIAKSGKFEE